MLFLSMLSGIAGYVLLFAGLKGKNLVVVSPNGGNAAYGFKAPWMLFLAPFGAATITDTVPVTDSSGANTGNTTTKTYEATAGGILGNFVAAAKGNR